MGIISQQIGFINPLYKVVLFAFTQADQHIICWVRWLFCIWMCDMANVVEIPAVVGMTNKGYVRPLRVVRSISQ